MIFLLCEPSSINRLIQEGRITFHSFNNTFGFVKVDDKYIAKSYHLQVASNNPSHIPEGYKGFYSDVDLLFFVDQIENFQQIAPVKESLNATTIAEKYLTLTEETLKYIKTGKATINRLQALSKKGAQEKKQNANNDWQPYLEKGLELAKKSPKKLSASELARRIIKACGNDAKQIKNNTLRKRISSHEDICQYLRPKKNAKLAEPTGL
jgi:hypothetical protein